MQTFHDHSHAPSRTTSSIKTSTMTWWCIDTIHSLRRYWTQSLKRRTHERTSSVARYMRMMTQGTGEDSRETRQWNLHFTASRGAAGHPRWTCRSGSGEGGGSRWWRPSRGPAKQEGKKQINELSSHTDGVGKPTDIYLAFGQTCQDGVDDDDIFNLIYYVFNEVHSTARRHYTKPITYLA